MLTFSTRTAGRRSNGEALLERGTEENDGAYWARAVRYIACCRRASIRPFLGGSGGQRENSFLRARTGHCDAGTRRLRKGKSSGPLEAFRVAPNLPFPSLIIGTLPTRRRRRGHAARVLPATLLHPYGPDGGAHHGAVHGDDLFRLSYGQTPEVVLEEIRTELAKPCLSRTRDGRSQIEAACGGDDADWETWIRPRWTTLTHGRTLRIAHAPEKEG